MTLRLQIINYFDSLVDRFDLKAEQLLSQLPDEDENKKFRLREIVNERRRRSIAEIEACKRFNLDNFNDAVDTSAEKMFKKYCFVISNSDVDFTRYLNCYDNYFLLDEPINMDIIINETFGYLIQLDTYVSDRKLHLLRQLLKIAEYEELETVKNDVLNPETEILTYTTDPSQHVCLVHIRF